MRAFKYMLAGILFASAIAQPAVAGALTQADIDFVFDPAAGYTVDGLIPLSPAEMDQIEGQYWVLYWQRIARAIQGFYHGIQRGVTFSIGRFTYYIRHDPQPHMFGREWGPLKGNRPHWQVTRWVKGVDESHRNFRLPWGAKQPPGKYPKGHRGGRKKGEPRAPRSPDSSGSPDSLSAGDDTRTPSDQLIQLDQLVRWRARIVTGAQRIWRTRRIRRARSTWFTLFPPPSMAFWVLARRLLRSPRESKVAMRLIDTFHPASDLPMGSVTLERPPLPPKHVGLWIMADIVSEPPDRKGHAPLDAMIKPLDRAGDPLPIEHPILSFDLIHLRGREWDQPVHRIARGGVENKVDVRLSQRPGNCRLRDGAGE